MPPKSYSEFGGYQETTMQIFKTDSLIRSRINLISILILFFVFSIHFHHVSLTAVDLPFWDDWTFFPNESPTWIIDFLNEHRTVPTKALIAFQYWVNGWDIKATLIFNFLIFGSTLAIFVLFLCWACDHTPTWAICLSCLCILTPRLSEVHHWGVGSTWHFVILFGTVGVWLLFRAQSFALNLLGVAFLLLSTYSTGQGLAFSSIAILIWFAYQLISSIETPDKINTQKILRSSGITIIYLCGLIVWFIGFRKISTHAEPANPWTPEFWNYFGLMIQRAFNFPQKLSIQLPWIGIIAYFFFTVAPMIVLASRRIFYDLKISSGIYAVVSMTCAVSGVLFLTCFGRGNFPIESAGSGRYVYYAIFLIPLSIALWCETLQLRNAARKNQIILALCFFVIALQYRHGLDFTHYYKNNQARLKNLEIISSYYKNGGPHPLYLPDFWVPMDDFLREAKERRYSFYRKLNLD